jgi:hypothetical protein
MARVKREGDLSKGKAAIRPNTRSSRYRGLSTFIASQQAARMRSR